MIKKEMVLPGHLRRLEYSLKYSPDLYTNTTSILHNQTFCFLLVLGSIELQVWLLSNFWRNLFNHQLLQMCFILNFTTERSTCWHSITSYKMNVNHTLLMQRKIQILIWPRMPFLSLVNVIFGMVLITLGGESCEESQSLSEVW